LLTIALTVQSAVISGFASTREFRALGLLAPRFLYAVMFQWPIGVRSGCRALVVVEDAAEALMSSDCATHGCRGAGREGDDIAQSLVIALGLLQVPFAQRHDVA
jgi:hypothetical protein